VAAVAASNVRFDGGAYARLRAASHKQRQRPFFHLIFSITTYVLTAWISPFPLGFFFFQHRTFGEKWQGFYMLDAHPDTYHCQSTKENLKH